MMRERTAKLLLLRVVQSGRVLKGYMHARGGQTAAALPLAARRGRRLG